MDNLRNEAPAPTVEFTKTFNIASMVHDKFQTSKVQRVPQEQVWIEAMQNFNGEYGPSVTFREGGSSVFINITQMKTMAAFSRIMAVEMGPTGFPWDIKPTPHPMLLQMGLTEQEATVTPEADPQFKKEVSQARAAADGMRNRIKDDLVESCWEEKFSRGVLDLVSLGTMIFKGPIGAPPKPKKWVMVDQQVSAMDRVKGFLGIKKIEAAKYVLSHDPMDEYRANIDWLSPFEFYPDPGAYSHEDLMWAVQRHVMNKAQLVELAADKNFDAEEIRTALDQCPDGNWVAEPWEGFLNTINRRAQAVYLSKRYQVLEFWGYLSGEELTKAGVQDIEDPHSISLCNVWVVGNNCIKIAVSGNQSNRIPYFITPYEKVPYKIWGRGVPEKMADPQSIINASARAMVENMGMAAGPQVIYDVNRVAPGTKVDQIIPWGIWPVKTIEGITTPPVQFQKIDPILNELNTIYSIFRNVIQEVTSQPDMTSGIMGNQQHNRTASGMEMIFGAADSYTKSVIFNIDNHLTKPMIRALYDWEMQYCPEMSIKGDMQIEACGVQGLMGKDAAAQNLAEVIQALGQIPGGADYINIPELVKIILRSKDIVNDAVILPDAEVEKRRKEASESKVQQEAQIAKAQNLAKPKAETTRNDAILAALERTPPTAAIYPDMYAKLLSGYNELDPQAQAALNIMKTQIIAENKAFIDQQDLAVMNQDIEMAGKLRALQAGAVPQGGGQPTPAPRPEPAPAQTLQIPSPGGVVEQPE